MVITKYPKPKDKKARVFVNLLDRSSSLVWMTHSHCVRSNSRKGRGFKSHSVHHNILDMKKKQF